MSQLFHYSLDFSYTYQINYDFISTLKKKTNLFDFLQSYLYVIQKLCYLDKKFQIFSLLKLTLIYISKNVPERSQFNSETPLQTRLP